MFKRQAFTTARAARLRIVRTIHHSSARSNSSRLLYFSSVAITTATVLSIGNSYIWPIRNDSKPVIESSKVNSPSPRAIDTGNPQIRNKMESLIREKQMEIVRALEQLDGKAKFRIDEWQRPNDGGYGRTAVIEDGDVFERGGVNISIVQGSLPPAAVAKMKADHKSLQTTGDGNVLYWVCGLSLIMHPQNPMAPTVHLNYRYFETQNQDGSPQAWWFGGGTDLTPNYLFEDDVKEFHSNLKKACDEHDKEYYPKFKKWCDDYFHVKHRKERRGVGGIFFDDLADRDPTQIYEFVKSSLNQFLPTYTAIISRRKDMPFNDKQREWQLIRRGRYVEFNLVHDRGTAFGLHAPGARIESILVSLPRNVMWAYDHAPEPGSEEDRLLEVLKNPREWVK